MVLRYLIYIYIEWIYSYLSTFTSLLRSHFARTAFIHLFCLLNFPLLLTVIIHIFFMQASSSVAEPDAATEHAAAETDVCMEDIVTEWRRRSSSDDARDLVNAAQTVLKGSQKDIRDLCKSWGVQLRIQQRYRPTGTLKQELKTALIKRAMKLKSETEASAGGAATERAEIQVRAGDALAEAPRSPIQVAAESTATEHAGAEFCLEAAIVGTLRSLSAIHGDSEILVRVVDHACHSEQCISHRVAAMCREAQWNVSEELCNDQPLDACGYIAADAVCRLREAALSEANLWHRMQLPDYARLECIDRGNRVLRNRAHERILDSDQVNQLVLHYSHVDQSSQAQQEWWAGAVALDHFLSGLPDMVSELAATTSSQQHRWRAWIVNTQSSTQLGSHWFTVVVGAAVQTAQELLQSTATSSAAGGTLELSQPLQSTGPRANPSIKNYPNLFESPDTDLSNVLDWAHAHATHPHVAAWLRACSQWDSAIATKEYQHQKKRRRLCKEHDIQCTKAIDSNKELDTAIVHIRRQLINRIKDIRAGMMSLQHVPTCHRARQGHRTQDHQALAPWSPCSNDQLLRTPHFAHRARNQNIVVTTSLTSTSHLYPLATHVQR